VLEIDGSRYSGSGAIVRQAVAFAALTGKPIRISNIRARRPKPGLRRQHAQVIESIRQLVGGDSDGVAPGSQEIVFRPGDPQQQERYVWDIGTAGSTTALALAVLPVLAFSPVAVSAELRGGLFQDFAPSFYHLEQVMLPLLRLMGIDARVRMERPGYAPAGGGILQVDAVPMRRALHRLNIEHPGRVERVWGIALSSHLKEQSVSERMADAAKRTLSAAGYTAEIRMLYDDDAAQPGAALAAFADLSCGSRIGADRAGARGRPSEAIGSHVARKLLEDVASGATIDRHASDQIIAFAALAAGESRFRIPAVSEHVESSAWLCRELLGAEVSVRGSELVVKGIGFNARAR
jgi:RNA 3'-terminal phosphate cyclase (ATP)